MYDGRTGHAPSPHARDERFRVILQHAADTIAQRISRYDASIDPLTPSQLKLLHAIVTSEIDRVCAGLGHIYAGLESPIRAVSDWGEPTDSELSSALRKAEIFFQTDYRKAVKAVKADRIVH